jgi:ribosomal protein RSM22 (predicted rRNA methylase)
MELPAALRHAVDHALEGVPLAALSAAALTLSRRYRGEIRDGRFHIDDDLAARAYLATRLPATYAAIRAALAMVEERLPGYAPTHLLDLGAGPGTALWAVLDCWPRLAGAVLLEGSAAIRRQGELLIARALPATPGGGTAIAWADTDLADPDAGAAAAGDLVTLCYVLDELAPAARERLVDWAWSRAAGLLLIVEPGTPAGWHRILAARDQLIAAGARIVAPCPHARPCPLLPPSDPATAYSAADNAAAENWCHFSRRVARSRLHRLVKQADVPWEDEKFIFIAAARPAACASVQPPDQPARIIAPVRQFGGQLQLQLCDAAGRGREVRLSKRDGDAYKRARRRDWGDSIDIADHG